jgi:DNA-binding NarL/FixJ family response regulator
MNEPKKILIADDHKIFLDGLNLILNEINHIKIVAQASNGKEAVEAFKNIEIDIAIIDLNMNDFSGIDLISALKSIQPKCKIIVLSMVDDSSIIKSLLNNYIDAYVIKYGGKQELLEALHSIDQGIPYISPSINLNQLETEKKQSLNNGNIWIEKLTKREIEIIKLIALQMNSSQISEKLFLSYYTVKTHRKNILQKLELKNTAGLIEFANKNNLL